MVKLGNHIKLIGGGTPSKAVDGYWNGDIPWASVKDLKTDKINSTIDSITQLGVENSSTKLIPSGSLLIATRMAVGRVAISSVDLAINQDLKAIICDEKIHKIFLFYLLKSKAKYFDRISSGATVKGIKISHITDLKIPLPPLPEQKRIAAILDAADAYRQQTQALIGKYEELGQSLFLEMFGDPVRNEMGWEVHSMSEACTKVTDGTHDTPKRLLNGIKFITGKHIRPYKIDYENSDYVAENIHKEIFRRCNPSKGDVLYTNIGVNLGTAALNTVDYEFSMKNVALLKCKKGILDGRYLEYFLNSENMKSKIVWMASIGGAQQFLSLTELRRLKVLIPPITIQNQFASRIEAIVIQKAQAELSLAQAEDLFQSLLQQAFRGGL